MNNETRQLIRMARSDAARKRARLERRIELEVSENLRLSNGGFRCSCKSMRNHKKGCVNG